MKRITFFAAILSAALVSVPLFGQYTQKEFDLDLWPNGLPNTNGIDHLPFDDNVNNYKPSLRVFLDRKSVV